MNTRTLGLQLGLMKAAATQVKPPLKPFYSKALPVAKGPAKPVVVPKTPATPAKSTPKLDSNSEKKFPHEQNEDGLNDKAGYNNK